MILLVFVIVDNDVDDDMLLLLVLVVLVWVLIQVQHNHTKNIFIKFWLQNSKQSNKNERMIMTGEIPTSRVIN